MFSNNAIDTNDILDIHKYLMTKTKCFQHESETLANNISWECKCRFDGKQCSQINGGITINVDESIKDVVYVKKDYIWNPSKCNCKWKRLRKYYGRFSDYV